MVTESTHKQYLSLSRLPTHSVTIYPSCAAIVRNISNVTILPGRNEITLDNLTSDVEEHTIKVEALNTAWLVTDVEVELVRNAQPDTYAFFSEDDDEYSSSEGETGGEGLSLNASAEGGMKAVSPVTSEQASQYADTADAPEAIGAAHLLTASTGARVDDAEISKSGNGARKPHVVRERERESSRLEQQEVKLHTPKDVYRVRVTIELESPPKETTPTASVDQTGCQECAKRTKAPVRRGSGPSLQVSYVTRGASWTLRYGVRLDTLTNTGVLTHRANFFNRTGETWGNARITLSTAQPSFSGLGYTAPSMGSWYISLGRNWSGDEGSGGLYSAEEKKLQDDERRKRLIGRYGKEPEDQEHDNPSRGDDGDDEGSTTITLAAPPDSLGVRTPTAEFYGLKTTYRFPGTRTVISSDQVSRYIIAEYRLTEITFSHISVPKLHPSAFLKARIRNPSASALFQGPAGLSLDGAFLGTAKIPLCKPGDHFELDLGVDRSVLVEYGRSTRAVASQGKPEGEKAFTYQRCISICNTRKNFISLVVIDQVPVSRSSILKVRVRKPLGLEVGDSAKGAAAGIAVVGADKEVVGFLADATVEMRKDGEVRWEAKVQKGARVRIGLGYEAEFPTGYKIYESGDPECGFW